MDVLVVGPTDQDTGGIAQYVTESVEHVDELRIRTYDISPPDGTGCLWLLCTLYSAILDAFGFAMSDKPDIVHYHTSHSLSFIRASFYVLFTSYVWRQPVVLHIHGSSFDDFVHTDSKVSAWFQSVVFDATSHVIALSPYWKKVIGHRVTEEKITTVPNAIDPAEYDPTPDGSIPHIVFLSNLIERKGISEFVTALRRLNGEDFGDYQVTIAGKGTLADQVERVANDFAYVHYRGYVSEEEKRAILESGSIYVLPSHAEGLPIAILEAMAGGNAIISTTVGSIPEVITEENGITVEPGNVNDLTKALRTLLSNPNRVRSMGRHSRELAQERYSWNAVATRLEEIYASYN